MFLQIHTLTSFHASLLNRDDAGLAKRIPFGDAPRTRVSSQCQKRHWRLALADMLPQPGAFRSTHFFERIVFPRVKEAGIDEALARELTEKLIAKLISNKAAEKGTLVTKQPVMFGQPEADYLVNLLVECAADGRDPAAVIDEAYKEHKSNWRAMLAAAGGSDLVAGIEGALFGRFVTSDILSRTDAAVHVAHAMTVHPLDNEIDFFSVVDDLKEEGEHAGAGHIGDMELGAGLFYGYVVVDVPLLVSNLSGCDRKGWREALEAHADARQVLTALIRAIATVSPGAKLGATAPYARTDFLMLETGDSQPRALSNAFLQAVRPQGDVMAKSVSAISTYLGRLDGMYGPETERFIASTTEVDRVPGAQQGSLSDITESALERILG